MFKHYLEGIKNIEIGPIISLNLFFCGDRLDFQTG